MFSLNSLTGTKPKEDNMSKLDNLRTMKMEAEEAQKRVAAAEEEAKGELREKVVALLKGTGFTLADLFPRAGTASGSKRKSQGIVPVRYRDPDNADNTWTGRGRQPTWLVNAIAAGKKVEDFALPEAT